jgi:hypothetical protein
MNDLNEREEALTTARTNDEEGFSARQARDANTI